VRADGGVLLTARVAQTPFYDPKNERQTADDAGLPSAPVAPGGEAFDEARA
jgi:hypothetical protein